jgi:rare lipoprotein A
LLSKWRHWVATLVCGLLLLNGSSAVWAASKKHVTASKKHAVKYPKKTHKTSPRKDSPSAEILQAEIADQDTIGLRGQASFYGHGFQGRKTSTGERFDVKQFTAASNHFSLGTMVAVRRLDNDRCAIVKVNDRMHAKHRRRVIDVSRGVAEYLGMIQAGVVLVRVAALKTDAANKEASACQAAFDPIPEAECIDCGQLPKLPDFLNLPVN